MTTSASNSSSPTFSTSLAATLYPQLVHLAELSSLAEPTPSTGEAESRVSKLDLGKAATNLRTALQTLKIQASSMKSGELSLDDQDWLVGKLEKELETRRLELAKLADSIPHTTGQTGMEVALGSTEMETD